MIKSFRALLILPTGHTFFLNNIMIKVNQHALINLVYSYMGTKVFNIQPVLFHQCYLCHLLWFKKQSFTLVWKPNPPLLSRLCTFTLVLMQWVSCRLYPRSLALKVHLFTWSVKSYSCQTATFVAASPRWEKSNTVTALTHTHTHSSLSLSLTHTALSLSHTHSSLSLSLSHHTHSSLSLSLSLTHTQLSLSLSLTHTALSLSTHTQLSLSHTHTHTHVWPDAILSPLCWFWSCLLTLWWDICCRPVQTSLDGLFWGPASFCHRLQIKIIKLISINLSKYFFKI